MAAMTFQYLTLLKNPAKGAGVVPKSSVDLRRFCYKPPSKNNPQISFLSGSGLRESKVYRSRNLCILLIVFVRVVELCCAQWTFVIPVFPVKVKTRHVVDVCLARRNLSDELFTPKWTGAEWYIIMSASCPSFLFVIRPPHYIKVVFCSCEISSDEVTSPFRHLAVAFLVPRTQETTLLVTLWHSKDVSISFWGDASTSSVEQGWYSSLLEHLPFPVHPSYRRKSASFSLNPSVWT